MRLSIPKIATAFLVAALIFITGFVTGNAAEPDPVKLPARPALVPLSPVTFTVPVYVGAFQEAVDAMKWNEAVAAQEAEQAAQEVAAGATATGSQTAVSPPAAAPSGDCYGGPLPDYVYTRESGGDPNAVNPSSGARGCGQVMPFVHDANCADLGYSVPEQHECEQRLINVAGMSPWAG